MPLPRFLISSPSGSASLRRAAPACVAWAFSSLLSTLLLSISLSLPALADEDGAAAITGGVSVIDAGVKPEPTAAENAAAEAAAAARAKVEAEAQAARAAAAAAHAADPIVLADRATLVATEIEHVEDLLSLHRPDAVAPHLEVLRRLEPGREALWIYYAGQVLLQQDHPVELIALYQGCKRADYDDDLWSSLQRSRFLAYCNLGEFHPARALAEAAAAEPALYPWSLDADLELAKAMYRQALNLSAVDQRRTLREKAVGMLAKFAERMPYAERKPWLAFTEAELYYERLQTALTRFHDEFPAPPEPPAGDAATADTVAIEPGTPLPTSLRVFVYQVRALFLAVQVKYPESAEGFRALRRVNSLERELQIDADARAALTGRDTALPPEDEAQPDDAPALDVSH